MKINFKTCTEKELWHYVAVHLKKRGIDTVLVGGSVVSIYTDGAYQSGDLDFVRLDLFAEGVEEAMDALHLDLEEDGPTQSTWPNYSKFKGLKKNVDKRHWHLLKGKPTYVACWEVIDKKKQILEVYYAGTHEKAPY